MMAQLSPYLTLNMKDSKGLTGRRRACTEEMSACLEADAYAEEQRFGQHD